MEFRREVLKGTLDLLLLALLSEKESYGYELISRLEKQTRGFFEVKEGSAYPALHRLEKAEFLNAYWNTKESPPRKYYRVTEMGLRRLNELQREWWEYISAVEKIIGEEEDCGKRN